MSILTDDECRELVRSEYSESEAGGYEIEEFARKVEAAVLAKLREQEPVAWQWRKKGDDWSIELTFVREVYASTQDTEVRPLYAAPVAPAQPMTLDNAAKHFPSGPFGQPVLAASPKRLNSRQR